MNKPNFIYGTAWKEDKTKNLVISALKCGFRAIDTANQRKHYFEAAVGQALSEFIELNRKELFLQSKYTYQRGQDHRLPYNPHDSIGKQVKDSLQSSLSNLGVAYLDSYLLHGPWGSGLSPEDLEAWQTLEEFVVEKKVLQIGVSNFSPEQLNALLLKSQIKPSYVQNRCYAHQGWDATTRKICADHGITYQGFSLLTANRAEIHSDIVQNIADKHDSTIAQTIFAFCRAIGILPLTGTSSPQHMKEDLNANSLILSVTEIAAIEQISTR